uniref:GA module-containing protein n=1 Tax=Staphylococcus pasteuri TaxID=45972 RepID=UPI0012B6D9E2
PNTLKSTKAPLHGDQNLQPPKQQPIHTITNPNHLNQPQNNPLTQQLTQPQNLLPFTHLQNNPNPLHTPIHQLQQPLPHHNTILTHPNYTNPSPQKQAKYTHP